MTHLPNGKNQCPRPPARIPQSRPPSPRRRRIAAARHIRAATALTTMATCCPLYSKRMLKKGKNQREMLPLLPLPRLKHRPRSASLSHPLERCLQPQRQVDVQPISVSPLHLAILVCSCAQKKSIYPRSSTEVTDAQNSRNQVQKRTRTTCQSSSIWSYMF